MINLFFQHNIQGCMCVSANVGILQRNKKWFFRRHIQSDSGFHVMTVNEISWDRPEIIFSFRIILCWVRLFVGMEKRVRLILLEEFLVPLSFRTIPDQSGCSQILIFSKNFDCSIRDCEYKNGHLSLALTLPLHWAFGRGVQTRPSAPILQCLRPWCLLSRITRIQDITEEIFLARLQDQIDAIATGLQQKQGDIRPLLQMVSLVRQRAFRTAFHMVSSNQATDPEHVAVSSNTPWNLPTNFHSDLISTIQQRCLPSLCALLFQQSHLFLICVVSTCNDSRIILHKTC